MDINDLRKLLEKSADKVSILKEIGGEIYVSNIGQGVQRIFRMSGLFKILKTSREMDCFVNEGGQNEQI